MKRITQSTPNMLLSSVTRTLIFVLAYVISSGCHSDEDIKLYYYQEIENKRILQEVRSLVSEEKFAEADALLDEMVCVESGCRMRNYYKAIAQSYLHPENTYDYLQEAILMGHARRYIQDDKFGIPLDSNVLQTALDNFQRKKNSDYYRKLQEITNDDQRVRQQCKSVECAHLIDEVDSRNLAILDSIVRHSGWPGFTTIGHFVPMERTPQPILILLHSDEPTNDRYIPLIRESCLNNDTYWSEYINLLSNKLIRYNFRSDSILVDFIPEYTLDHLEQNLPTPEVVAIKRYLETRGGSFLLIPVNGTKNARMTELIGHELQDNFADRISIGSSVQRKEVQKGTFLLVKNSRLIDTHN